MTSDVHTAWDDLETLVFEREDVLAALAAAQTVLDGDTTVALVAPATLVALDEEELWLASLPAAARAVLEVARRGVGEWPHAPRLSHAIARPAH